MCIRNRGLRGLHGGRGKDFMLMLSCLVLSLFMGKHSVPNEDKKINWVIRGDTCFLSEPGFLNQEINGMNAI